MLAGKRALVAGIADEHSIAWGCARAFRDAGAELAITYRDAKDEMVVRQLAHVVEASIVRPLDLRDEGELDAVFQEIDRVWGGLDILLHSVAFAPRNDLQGRVTDCSREGFLAAMDISVHSFIRLVRRAEARMTDGGACLTVSYHGAQRVVSTYNVMGPVKAALEATTRELASELGSAGIRVNALSPGPLPTRAASGLDHFDELLTAAQAKAPMHRTVTIEECGAYAAFLASDAARSVTGSVHYVDGGFNIMA